MVLLPQVPARAFLHRGRSGTTAKFKSMPILPALRNCRFGVSMVCAWSVDRNLIVAAFVVSLLLAAPAGAARMEEYVDKSMAGNYYSHWDLNSFAPGSKESCRDACLNDPRCGAVAYVLPEFTKRSDGQAECWVIEGTYTAADLIYQPYTFYWLKVEEKGYLWVTSEPSGANLVVHGQSQGVTPKFVYDLSPGTYMVFISMDGYEDWQQNVVVQANRQTEVNAQLVASAPAFGWLEVTSVPSGATVFVDGDRLGHTTPAKIARPPGSCTVEVTKTGYQDYTGTWTVTAGQTTVAAVTLTATSTAGGPQGSSATTGTISVTSTPSGAQVYVDDVGKGTTPKTITGVAAGSHAVSVSLSGYEDYETMVNVVAGGTTNVNAVLKKGTTAAPGSIEVRSTPTGAAIKLDGSQKGVTPSKLTNVKAGVHELVLTLSGYPDYKQTVTVKSGETLSVTAQMGSSSPSSGQQSTGSGQQAAASGTGTLSVTTIPAGAQAYLDGNLIGNTPTSTSGVSAGTHTLRLSMSGYSDVAVPVTITAGQTTQYSTSMVAATPAPGGLGIPGFTAILGMIAVMAVIAGLGLHKRSG